MEHETGENDEMKTSKRNVKSLIIANQSSEGCVRFDSSLEIVLQTTEWVWVVAQPHFVPV
jgi:hypothetical protein